MGGIVGVAIGWMIAPLIVFGVSWVCSIPRKIKGKMRARDVIKNLEKELQANGYGNFRIK